MARRKRSKGGNSNERNQRVGKTSNYQGSSTTGSSGVGKESEADSSIKEGSKDSSYDHTKGKNDPEWYSRDPALLQDAGRINFTHPLGDMVTSLVDGSTYTDGALKVTMNTANWHKYSEPGILTLDIKSSVGYSLIETDPINVAAVALYSKVRYVNSGRKNYETPDLMIYVLSMAEIFSFIQWCKRIYAYGLSYSQRNKYIGWKLLMADGINPANLVNNLANFRYWLNSFIRKIQAFALPADIYYFRRRAFMFSNYYIENSLGNIKDQLYMFHPDGFFRYNIDSNTSKGMLEYGEFTRTGLKTVNDLITYGNWLMANINGDEDFGIMSGDILKAFEGNIIGLDYLSEDYLLDPVYDPYVLSQFKNATIMDVDRGGAGTHTYTVNGDTFKYGNVYQDNSGNLVCKEYVPLNENGDLKTAIIAQLKSLIPLSCEVTDPDPGYVVEATRLIACQKHGEVLGVLNSGVDIVVRGVVSVSDGNAYSILNEYLYSSAERVSSTYVQITDNRLRAALKFKYSPTIMLSKYDTDPNDANNKIVSSLEVISNLDNVTYLIPETLDKLHDCACLSLFFVPGVARLMSNL